MENSEKLVSKLRNMYTPEKLYDNFGNVLLNLEVQGIRGVSASCSFDFPITVIIGKNGSGKSTLAQLALCCYRYKPEGDSPYSAKDYYNLGNFFIKSNLDPTPYTRDAKLMYTYAIPSKEDSNGQLTFSDYIYSCPAKTNTIQKINSDWGGYKRRPDRRCIYFGMGFFVPHHEMGDRIYLDPKTSISRERSFSQVSINKSIDILGTPYNTVEVATIINQSKEAEMSFASRFGAKYSVNHMGCGEGRLIRMFDAIENAPDRSLVVIEEPETALHQDAQYNLAVYFLEVCKRKKHQIIITTHSPAIVEAMPMEARKKIQRTSQGTTIENNPTIAEIVSDLSNGHKKSHLIYVEDAFSKRILIEILRQFAPELLRAVSIADVGNKDDVLQAVRYTIKHTGVSAIGIRDEAPTASNDEPIFAYPFVNAPEKEIFHNLKTQEYLLKQYKIDFREEIPPSEDHHNYSESLSKKCRIDKSTIETQCIQAYLAGQDYTVFDPLLSKIKENCK